MSCTHRGTLVSFLFYLLITVYYVINLVGLENEPMEEVVLENALTVPEGMNPVAAGYFNAFYRSLEQLYNAIVNGEVHPHLPTFEDGMQVQIVSDGIKKSHEVGKIIKFQ